MRIVLVRHGIAIDRDDPDCPPEAERHLTKEGILRTRQAMRGLLALGVQPEAMVTSPYVRAEQTARIAAEVFGLDADDLRRTEALLPGAEPTHLLRELATIEEQVVALFGHAPNLDEVIAHVVGARTSFTALKKAGAACLEVDPPKAGNGLLVWLYPAAALRIVKK